jgi:hypothetical protein
MVYYWINVRLWDHTYQKPSFSLLKHQGCLRYASDMDTDSLHSPPTIVGVSEKLSARVGYGHKLYQPI